MKKLLIILTMALMIILTACGEDGASMSTDHSRSVPTDSSASVPVSGSETTKAVVCIDYADETLLADSSGFDELIDDDSEYQVKAVLTTNIAVKEFRYVELGFAEGNGETAFYVADELYSQDELSPERPLVIGMAFAGAIPDRGISFVDETGAIRYYSISMSGENGSLLLIEISEPIPRP